MSKPIAYYNPEYKMIVEDTTHPHLYLPLFAIDDETREALAVAIRAMECMEYDERHIAALERLRGTSG